MRGEIDKVFGAQGPGWVPRQDDSGIESKQETAKIRARQALRTKLRADLRRATKRLRAGKGKQKAVDNRYEVLKEFERLSAGGSPDKSLLSDRKSKSLRGRIGRAEDKAAAEQGQVLGRIASSIKARVQGNVLEIYSSIPWAGVHNEGGTAGHGARIPERRFLEWTPERVAKLAEIAEQYVAEKMK